MSALRLAVIGAGHLGRIHAKLAKSSEQFNVVGVADPSPAALQLVIDQLGLPTFPDYKQLLGKIDAAIVAAPTVLHYEVASALLRSGVHVLVEKPLASSSEQAGRLVQIARHHQRVLQTGHVERFNPVWTAAIPHLHQPKYIEGMRAGPYSGRSTDIGVVMDLMIHDLDLVLSLVRSEITQISASGIAVVGGHEDLAEARIEFASGCIASLRVSRLATQATRRMQVFASESYANIDFSASEVQIVKANDKILHREISLDRMPPAERMAAKDSIYGDLLSVQTITAPSRNAILDEQNDFALSIRSGVAPAVTGEDGYLAVDAASRVLEAIADHRWDGVRSKPWRIGALAEVEPQILAMPHAQIIAASDTKRRAS
jgi:predicted dehydrogenase